MAHRFVLAVLVLAALLADRFGAHGAAFDALLLAVPFAAAGLLRSIGELVDGRAERQRSVFSGLLLALIVVGAAARSPVVGAGGPSALAESAVLACVGLFCVEALLGVAAELRLARTEASSPRASRA